MGGEACVRRTRIAVWMLIESKQLGSTDAKLLHNYPALTADDLAAAWEYARVNRDEIEDAIRRNNEDVAKTLEAGMITATEAPIQKTPNVMGGEACVRRTRIAVWMLVEAWGLGFSDEELLTHYVVPLGREDLSAARTYYAAHREEIDAAVRRNEDV